MGGNWVKETQVLSGTVFTSLCEPLVLSKQILFLNKYHSTFMFKKWQTHICGVRFLVNVGIIPAWELHQPPGTMLNPSFRSTSSCSAASKHCPHPPSTHLSTLFVDPGSPRKVRPFPSYVISDKLSNLAEPTCLFCLWVNKLPVP